MIVSSPRVSGLQPDVQHPFVISNEDSRKIYNLWEESLQKSILVQRTIPNDACELTEGFWYGVDYADYLAQKYKVAGFLEKVKKQTTIFIRVLGPTLEDIERLQRPKVSEKIGTNPSIFFRSITYPESNMDFDKHLDTVVERFDQITELLESNLGEINEKFLIDGCVAQLSFIYYLEAPNRSDMPLRSARSQERLLGVLEHLYSKYRKTVKKLSPPYFISRPSIYWHLNPIDSNLFNANMLCDRVNSILHFSNNIDARLFAFFNVIICSTLNSELVGYNKNFFFVRDGNTYRLEDHNYKSFDIQETSPFLEEITEIVSRVCKILENHFSLSADANSKLSSFFVTNGIDLKIEMPALKMSTKKSYGSDAQEDKSPKIKRVDSGELETIDL